MLLEYTAGIDGSALETVDFTGRSLDYEDFVVAGEMSQLEIKEPAPCK